jgi:ectoine hydroxylase-related dioxygenase (phytanoyl-CoA dioxygenase family)
MQHFAATTDFTTIFQAFQQDGGVIIKGLLSPSEVASFNREIQPAMERLYTGTISNNNKTQELRGGKTKRFNNLACESETFRQKIIEKDLLYQILDAVFNQPGGAGYWLSSTQVIELQPGASPQPLHRDQDLFRFWNSMGPSAPEALVNFMFAMTPFTEANGATRLVPGSHRWPMSVAATDPTSKALQGVKSIPLEMDPGDCFIMSSKLLHGGGYNSTATERRRGLAIAVIRHDLGPNQAYALTLPRHIASSMSYRVQSLYGLRSACWADDENTTYSFWAAEEEDVGTRLGLPTNGLSN